VDLWNALSMVSGVDVANNMKLWIEGKGYPVLTVTEMTDGIQIVQSPILHYGNRSLLAALTRRQK